MGWERHTREGPSSSESQGSVENSDSEKFQWTKPTFRSHWWAFGSRDVPNRDGLQGKPSRISFRSNLPLLFTNANICIFSLTRCCWASQVSINMIVAGSINLSHICSCSNYYEHLFLHFWEILHVMSSRLVYICHFRFNLCLWLIAQFLTHLHTRIHIHTVTQSHTCTISTHKKEQ